MNYQELFETICPNFFENEYIRNLPENLFYDEQILSLKSDIPFPKAVVCPERISFGFRRVPIKALREAVALVDEGWVKYYNEDTHAFCAYDGDKVVSFCVMDEMSKYHGLRIGGPGCVGTIPEYRRQGIGLRMVQLGTEILRNDGFDFSYIHYTGVGHWYAKLGYKTIVRWNCKGIIQLFDV